MQNTISTLGQNAWVTPGVVEEGRFEAPEAGTDMRFYKTKLCMFWEENRCSKGASCKYAHGEAELQSAPNLEKTVMCKQLGKDGVCGNPACKFAHSADELRVVPDKFLKSSWQGEKNRYAHTEDELLGFGAQSQEWQMNGDADEIISCSTAVDSVEAMQVPTSNDRYQRRGARKHLRGGRRGQMQDNYAAPQLQVPMLPTMSCPMTPVAVTDTNSPVAAAFPIGAMQNQSTDQGFICSCGVVNEESGANFCKYCGSKRPANEMPMQFAVVMMPFVSAMPGMVPVQG